MTDPTIAVAPTPPKIAKLTTRRGMRVAINYSPAPYSTPLRSTDAQEYGRKLGFETTFLVGNSEENAAVTWGDSTKAVVNGCDPLRDDVAKAVVSLAQQPTQFGATLLPYQPIALDIEGTATYNTGTEDPAVLLGLIKSWTGRLDTYRKYMGREHELYAYDHWGYAFVREWWDERWTPEVAEADRRMMLRLSGFNAGLYNTDVTAQNPGVWFSQFDTTEGYIQANYPFLAGNKWVTLTPTYQIYGTPKTVKNGDPVDLAVWEQQVEHISERDGWNILLWLPPSMSLKPVKSHLDFVAKYLK